MKTVRAPGEIARRCQWTPVNVAKTKPAAALLFILAAALFLCSAPPARVAGAQVPAALRVRASNAFKVVLDELRPQCEQTIGQPVLLQYDTSRNLGRSITGDDDAFDVVILNPNIMEILTKADKLAPGSRVDIARATFGVGVPSGAPRPDVSTAAAVRTALLRARTITFPNEGASAPFIRAMFDKLGIAAELKPHLMPEPTTYPALANVAEGRADLVITLTNELLPAKGIDYAGPVPDEFQGDLIFSAAIGAKAPNAQAARLFINFLRTPAVVPTLKANGMEARK